MSYLIRCDVCGREIAEEDHDCTLRIEAYFENSDNHAYTRHVCQRCSADFERFMSVLQKRKEE